MIRADGGELCGGLQKSVGISGCGGWGCVFGGWGNGGGGGPGWSGVGGGWCGGGVGGAGGVGGVRGVGVWGCGWDGGSVCCGVGDVHTGKLSDRRGGHLKPTGESGASGWYKLL